MKNMAVITERLVCNGQAYKVLRGVAETASEKKIGTTLWAAVHESYTEADLPLTGRQLLLSGSEAELQRNVEFDAAARNFKAEHPVFTPEELCAFLMSL